MEFFINHTRKQIEYAGCDAHLNKFLEKLSELVETKNWSFKDDVQLYIFDLDSYMAQENVRLLIETKGYTINEEHKHVFISDEDIIGKAYDAEMEREALRDYNRYGDERSWSGWDTVGATCDV